MRSRRWGSTPREYRFTRVSKANPCPICHKPDWCCHVEDDRCGRIGTTCSRVEARSRWGARGWFHSAGAGPGRMGRPAPKKEEPVDRRFDFPEIATSAARAGQVVEITQLARDLGVDPDSLRRLGTGFLNRRIKEGYRVGSWGTPYTFPMRDGRGRVIGIQLRTKDGKKLAVRGSRNGLLFDPAAKTADVTLITEGQSDTAAALTLGFEAIGIPGVMQGVDYLLTALNLRCARDVVVVADRDDAGIGGARALVVRLRDAGIPARVVFPSAPHKDLRAWLQAGATAEAARAHFRMDGPEKNEIQETVA